jgi:hypothetical protein
MAMSDTPLQRTIKIGNASVGLIGIDTALNHVLLQEKMSEEEVAAYLYNEIKKHNYIPASTDHLYRKALLREYKKLRSEEVDQENRLQIRILGPGCVSCNKLGTMLFEILQTMNVPADIEQIHDLDEIWRYGVLSTPALVINDKVLCAGKMPTSSEVENWLREIIA